MVAIDASTAFAFGQAGTLVWDGRQWRQDQKDAMPPASAAVVVPGQRQALAVNGNQAYLWDGRWYRSTAPGQSVQLNAVSASGGEDGWVVGDQSSGNQHPTPYAAHWDRRRLVPATVPAPAGAPLSGLSSVLAVSSSDAWAAGWYATDPNSNDYGTFAVHWDGHAWHQVALPHIQDGTAEPSVRWVRTAGTVYLSIDTQDHLLLRRQGNGWRSVVMPSNLTVAGRPVVADGTDGLWFGGTAVTSSSLAPAYVHYQPKGGWSQVPVPQDTNKAASKASAQAYAVSLAPVPGTSAIWSVVASSNGTGDEGATSVQHSAMQLYGSLT